MSKATRHEIGAEFWGKVGDLVFATLDRLKATDEDLGEKINAGLIADALIRSAARLLRMIGDIDEETFVRIARASFADDVADRTIVGPSSSGGGKAVH